MDPFETTGQWLTDYLELTRSEPHWIAKIMKGPLERAPVGLF
jgi:hypothetical protein